MAADARRLLCVSLHDVAPATFADCTRALELLDGLRLGPVALLVVPDYHGLGRVDKDRRFTSFINERIARGDEVVLHGFRHEDTAARCTGPGDWLERHVYTAGEGEFSRLNAGVARTRILRGLAVLRCCGWRPRGFVAPAWLMSEGTLEALDALPLRYFATRDRVVALSGDARISAPSLVASTCSAWRRAGSIVWNRLVLMRHAADPVLRIALHPADVRYPSVVRLWQRLLTQARDREVITEGELVSIRHGTGRRQQAVLPPRVPPAVFEPDS